MVSLRISRHTPDSSRAGIRIPGISASPQKANHVSGVFFCRNSSVKSVCIWNKQFFFTPHKFNDPGVRIAFDSALESGSGSKSGETVQLTEGSLGFHNTQDFTHLC